MSDGDKLPGITWDPKTDPGSFSPATVISCDFETLEGYAYQLKTGCESAGDVIPKDVPTVKPPSAGTVATPQEAMSYCTTAAGAVLHDVCVNAVAALGQLMAYAEDIKTAGKKIAGAEADATDKVNGLSTQLAAGADPATAWMDRDYSVTPPKSSLLLADPGAVAHPGWLKGLTGGE